MGLDWPRLVGHDERCRRRQGHCLCGKVFQTLPEFDNVGPRVEEGHPDRVVVRLRALFNRLGQRALDVRAQVATGRLAIRPLRQVCDRFELCLVDHHLEVFVLGLDGGIPRPPTNGNGQLDLGAQVELARVAPAAQHGLVHSPVEVRVKAVVLLDRERVVLVRVALGTAERGPEPDRRGRIDPVDEHGVADLVDLRPP